MNIRNVSYVFALVAMLAIAGTAAAQGPVADAAITTAELEMTATVQTAVQLNISTGTTGATVGGSNATGLFTLAFGDLNGLGTGATQNANVAVAVSGTGALYTTPINLTPIYSGFTTETADVTVEEGASDDQALAREGGTAITTAAVTTAVTAFSNAASGSNNERFVGFFIARTTGAGAKTATLIYEVTVN